MCVWVLCRVPGHWTDVELPGAAHSALAVARGGSLLPGPCSREWQLERNMGSKEKDLQIFPLAATLHFKSCIYSFMI